MRDLHHLLAVLGSQLEEVVSNVVLVVVDSVAAVVRNDSDFNSGKLERSGAVHKIGQGLLRIAMKYKVAVLAVNQATDIMEEETRAMRMAQLEDKLEKKRGAKSLGFLESSDEE